MSIYEPVVLEQGAEGTQQARSRSRYGKLMIAIILASMPPTKPMRSSVAPWT